MRRTFKRLCLVALSGAISLSLLSCGKSGGTGSHSANPDLKLAVVMVVDQMRIDYLTRWSDSYTGGLHRLLENGAVFTNAHHDHATTVTAVGQSTIGTGTVPAMSGIVGNSFYSRRLGKVVSCVADTSTRRLGGEGGIGASPARLMRSALGDWLKAASPASKVFSASLKDRAAILMAGKAADGVFWYDKHDGDFVTSTYYDSTLPAWVASFNKSGAKDTWKDSLWTEGRKTARAGAESTFSHPVSDGENQDDYYEELYATPFADALLIDFGLDLLSSEHLGEDSIPDLFMISLSAADVVGHNYGPDSPEIEDYYFRLDSELAMFLDSLDARYGKNGYDFVLASDHGVCPLPEVAVEEGKTEYRRLLYKDYERDVAEVLVKAFPACDQSSKLIKPIYQGFMIDTAAASKCGLSWADVETGAAGALEQLSYVANVFTYDQLSADTTDDRPYAGLFRNSFDPDRSPDLIVNFKEGVLLTSASTGTSHGTPYFYDTDVPIVFYGSDISQKTVKDSVRTVDIAPTVAALLNVTPEAGVDGKVLPVMK